MKNRELIIAMVNRAIAEVEARKEQRGLFTGHKARAKRAIITARELLLEASKDLDRFDVY